MNTTTEEKAVKNCSVVATYDSHEKAESAIKELQKAGYQMKKLSIVGRDTTPMNKLWAITTTATA